MDIVENDTSSLLDRLEDFSNILVWDSTLNDAGPDLCTELLHETRPPKMDVLLVEYGSVDKHLDRWPASVMQAVGELKVINVGGMTRSAAATGGGSNGRSPPMIEAVSNPGDLTGVGMAITEALEAWSGNGNRTVICFHSVTTLLQYADLERVFRFLHFLTRRATERDAVAHYHINPDAHDSQTMYTLRILFDVVIEGTPKGDITIDRIDE